MAFIKSNNQTGHSQQSTAYETHALTTNLRDNIQLIQTTLGNSPDIVIREWHSEGENRVEAVVIYTTGLVDIKFINQFILDPLLLNSRDQNYSEELPPLANPLDLIKKKLLPVGGIRDNVSFDTLLEGILSGDTAILCQGNDSGLLIESKGWEERGVQEPTSQTVIRGPKEGFSENIITNIALVRRKIKDPNLWLEHFHVGRVTRTNVSIMYINGIAMETAVKEVRDRIGRIQIDGILVSVK